MNHKKVIFICIVLSLFSCMHRESRKTLSACKGPYLGQVTPEAAPLKFAIEIDSTITLRGTLFFRKTGDGFCYAIQMLTGMGV